MVAGIPTRESPGLSSLAAPLPRTAIPYFFSYTPLSRRSNTVNPALLASLIDGDFATFGVVVCEMTLHTGRRHTGQSAQSGRSTGRRSSKRPPQMLQSPPSTSYS